MKIKPGLEDMWKSAISIGPDSPEDVPGTKGYAQAIVDFTIRWADLMESAIEKGTPLEKCAEKLSHDADTDGITGNMYGMAVHLLSTYWVHGDTLRVWHNAKYNVGAEEKGTVNPAVFTMEMK